MAKNKLRPQSMTHDHDYEISTSKKYSHFVSHVVPSGGADRCFCSPQPD